MSAIILRPPPDPDPPLGFGGLVLLVIVVGLMLTMCASGLNN